MKFPRLGPHNASRAALAISACVSVWFWVSKVYLGGDDEEPLSSVSTYHFRSRLVNSTCRDALRNVPRASTFSQDADGAKAFLVALLDRQAVLQRCMAFDSLALRALVHRCMPDMLCGGLGDRVRGTVLALIIAAITDRSLFIDHRKPLGTSLETYLEPSGEVNWLMSSLPDAVLRWIGEKMNARKHLNKPRRGCAVWAKEWKRLNSNAVVGLQSNIAPTLLCVKKLFYAHLGEAALALVSEIKEYELTKLALHRLYKPTVLVKMHLSEMLAQLSANVKNPRFDADCAICFHIRTGKNVGAGKAIDPVLSQNFEDFGRCGVLVEKQRAKAKSCTSTAWYVVTDHGNTTSLFKTLSPYSKNASLITTSAFGSAYHIDRFTHQQSQTQHQVRASLLHLFTDFHLLQKCRFLVRSNSMFSLTATLSGPVGDEGVRYTVPHKSGCTPTSLNEHVFIPDELDA